MNFPYFDLFKAIFNIDQPSPEESEEDELSTEELAEMELEYALEQQAQSLAGAIARRAEEAGLIQKTDQFSREWHERYGEDWARAVKQNRWVDDKGAIPGEPIRYLDVQGDSLDSAAAVVIQNDNLNFQFTYDAVLADGTSLGTFANSFDAERAAEAAVASPTAAQPNGTAAPSHGTESGAVAPGGQAAAQAGRAGEMGSAPSSGLGNAGGLQGFTADFGSGFGGRNA